MLTAPKRTAPKDRCVGLVKVNLRTGMERFHESNYYLLQIHEVELHESGSSCGRSSHEAHQERPPSQRDPTRA
jgi:hypothetical protein